jgi:agmatinase
LDTKNDYDPTPICFLDLNPEENTVARSRTVILPVPYEATTSYKSGTKLGPSAIIRSSVEMEDYDPEIGTSPCTLGIHTAPTLEVSSKHPDQMVTAVAERVGWYAGQHKLVCTLGGEHSITSGAVAGIVEHYDNVSVLMLDAHADLRNEYQGYRNSHACAARRTMDHAPVTLVGYRSLAVEEAELIKKQGLPFFPRTEAPITNLGEILDTLSQNVYISIDMDVFDPSFMPAVGTPEPGGIGWWEGLSILRAVAMSRRIVGIDLMELAPNEGPEASSYIGAKLAYKVIGYATNQ